MIQYEVVATPEERGVRCRLLIHCLTASLERSTEWASEARNLGMPAVKCIPTICCRGRYMCLRHLPASLQGETAGMTKLPPFQKQRGCLSVIKLPGFPLRCGLLTHCLTASLKGSTEWASEAHQVKGSQRGTFAQTTQLHVDLSWGRCGYLIL